MQLVLILHPGDSRKELCSLLLLTVNCSLCLYSLPLIALCPPLMVVMLVQCLLGWLQAAADGMETSSPLSNTLPAKL